MDASVQKPTLWPSEKQDRPAELLVGNKQDVGNWIAGCPHSASLLVWSDTHRALLLCALPCRRWGCNYCGRKKIARYAIRCEAAKPNRFLTLTTWSRAYPTPRAAFEHGSRQLPELMRRIRNQIGPIDYFRVVEPHANGYPHWHILARGPYIDQKLLSTWWAELHSSPIVDVRRPDKIRSTYAYVVKYLAKVKFVQWTTRRVSFSRHFFPPESNPPNAGWKIAQKYRLKKLPEQVATELLAGRTLVRLTETAFEIKSSADLEDDFVQKGWINGRHVTEKVRR